MTKLYNLHRGDYFRILDGVQVPPDAPSVSTQTTYRLGNIDGMYSYCTDLEGNVVHVEACADVEKTA